MALLCGAFAMTSCSDDNDSNPVLTQPTAFVLNKPAVGAGTVDLLKSDKIDLAWSQPTPYTSMNSPVSATYTVQISNKGTFEKEYNQDLTPEENTGVDYITLDGEYNAFEAAISAEAVDKALMQLNLWDEASVPATLDLSVRIKSVVKDAHFIEHYPIYSNVEKISVVPYYLELADAPVEMWYILGGEIGNGGWSNNGDATGVANFPIFMISGFDYDKKDGSGELEYINWMTAGQGFKFLSPSRSWSWDYGFTSGGGENTIGWRNGDDDKGDIKVSADGLYKIVLNTKTHEGTIEAYDANAAEFAQICISGGINDWGDTDMVAVNNSGHNHVWYYSFSCSAPTEVKFKMAGSWDSNWGASTFPTGIGTNNGPNIAVPEGDWQVVFNDITGAYSFIAK